MRRRLLAVSMAAAVLAVYSGGASPGYTASADPGLSWRVEQAPFRLVYTDDGRQLTAQTPSSMGYRLTDGSSHQLTTLRTHSAGTYTVNTDEADRTATVRVERTSRGLRVSLTLQPAADVVQVSENLVGSLDEHFLGGGAHTMFIDLRRKTLLNKAVFVGASNFGKCNKNGAPTPFFISSAGYGIYPDTTAIGRLAFPDAAPDTHCNDAPAPCPVEYNKPDRIQLCFKTNRLDYEVYRGDPAAVTQSYFQRVGMPVLPPPRQFAMTKWRDKVSSQSEVIEDMVELQKRGIPLDSIWIDNPWEQGPAGGRVTYACIGALTFDNQQFPDPQGMIAQLKAGGVSLGTWVAPFLSKQSDGKPCPHDYPPGSFVQSDRTNVWDIDLTNPVARAHYEAKLEKLFRMGVSLVKGDRGEEHNFEESTFAGGPGTLIHNRYPLLYAESVTNMLRKVHGEDFATLFRAGYDGMPRILRGAWMADADMSFDGLRLTLRRGVNNSFTGQPVWGSDTGGYRKVADDSPSASLFTRWAQLSAISPVFQVGGPGRNATPWVYDDATVDRFRRSAILHYELFPYLYRLAQEASVTGVPITRAMAFSYPQDEEAWQADQQLMIGPDLLAAPVTADRAEADGAAGRPTPVDVYLPAGKWIDLHNGQVLDGGRHVIRESTLDEFPLYLRMGGGIAFNQRDPGIWPTPWGLNDIDPKDRTGWLVSPDAGVHIKNHTGGELTTQRTGKFLQLNVTGSARETQVTIPGDAPTFVLIDGRPVPQSTPAQLKGRSVGWTVKQGAFGGTVLKLHGSAKVLLYSR
ncbi:alpha-D-xyloside xylohydrolase [Kibdelosporangium banguiense]|uniref:Alpha-D-xyloside xylohydrolase n=1 Tax=Kibdelosporangium banguiense TaxID=1365924 RepID=A0ABS4T641_9PSEU|nr:glycoside hydrolase family 31 protein [Kibdelosporangium banguiense]MBP2319938.1 alpha-D-xyloside xylohydrolase [Kibdelosporangium banguiense]